MCRYGQNSKSLSPDFRQLRAVQSNTTERSLRPVQPITSFHCWKWDGVLVHASGVQAITNVTPTCDVSQLSTESHIIVLHFEKHIIIKKPVHYKQIRIVRQKHTTLYVC